MSHGIEEHDTGVVGFCETEGGTWHHMPQYVEYPNEIPMEEVENVFDFNMETHPLYYVNREGETQRTSSYGVIRKDTDHVVTTGISHRFVVHDHSEMFDIVRKSLLDNHPELKVESAGTLRNNATAFVNICSGDLHIKGDDSPHQTRLMVLNPIGEGAYTFCSHSVRVVCMNTVNAALGQADAQGSQARIRHQASAMDIIQSIAKYVDVSLGLQQGIVERLQMLTDVSMTTDKVEQYFEDFLPTSELSPRQESNREARLARIEVLRERDRGLTAKTRNSAYGWFQATIEDIDKFASRGVYNIAPHDVDAAIKNGRYIQSADSRWDGLMGRKNQQKERALNALLKLV